MRRPYPYILLLLLTCFCFSCSTKKNTKLTRFYQGFTTRFNVYFNGNQAYNKTKKEEDKKVQESYFEIIPMYTVSYLPKEKEEMGGPYDLAIEKSRKAIKEHSIKVKPAKKAGKSRDPKYQEFMARNEYNPYIHNAWLLMGKSQFQNGDFLAASATFSYIARLFKHDKNITAEARLWQARCSAEMGWLYETEDILIKLKDSNELPTKLIPLFSSVYADYLLKNNRHQEAIPYLTKAIGEEKSKTQKARMNYLLGQLYAETGNTAASYKAFQAVINASPPFELEFNARIRQSEVYAEVDPRKIIRKLNSMAKSDKNKEYLDQVYYALGNVYLSQKDTVNAIEKYELAIEKSTRNGIDKAICLIALGELFFNMRNYIKAQPCYTEALTIINDKHKNYNNIQKRSIVLDELVVHAEAVELQDSLQRLAKMPEEERMSVIAKIIEKVIKEEEEAKKQMAMEDYMARQEQLNADMNINQGGGINMPNIPTAAGGDNSWYFYNAQAVTNGKNTFQSKWGRRKLEDNWRRRNKQMSLFSEDVSETEDSSTVDQTAADAAVTDSTATGGDEPIEELSTDNKDPKFYLQQLPFTEEDVAASNAIIEDGLFNMGMIYKDKLEDFGLSAETFGTFLTRFPESDRILETYYQMWLMYMRQGDFANADIYKNKIITEFTDSDYATALADPDYIENIRNMDKRQEELYQATYDHYLNNRIDSVRSNTMFVRLKYPLSPLMPKFLFMNALTYVITNDANEFKAILQEIVEKYPEADVTALANDFLKGLFRGRQIVSDLAPTIGMRWNLRFGGEDMVADSSLVFSLPKEEETHLVLLIYPDKAIRSNNLIFEVAAFNFANFRVKQYDLSIESIGDMQVLNISGFENFEEARSYDGLIYSEEGYARTLPPTLFAIVISESNYEVLQKGKTLEEYFAFFENNYGTVTPEILERWGRNIEANARLLEGKESEEVIDVLPEPETPAGIEKPVTSALPGEEGLIPVDDTTPATEEKMPESDMREISPEDPAAPRKEAEKDSTYKEPEVIFYPQEDPARKVREQENLLKQLEKEEKERIEAEKAVAKQKEAEKKQQQKDREKARKQKEKEQKALQKQREKERNEQQKLKEQERKEQQKQRDAERKALQKQKAQEQKLKEQERKRQQKLKEEERKKEQKAKEAARKQNQKK